MDAGGVVRNLPWDIGGIPPVNVSLGEQKPPPETPSAGKIFWTIVLGASPVIVAGVIVWLITRPKPGEVRNG